MAKVKSTSFFKTLTCRVFYSENDEYLFFTELPNIFNDLAHEIWCEIMGV